MIAPHGGTLVNLEGAAPEITKTIALTEAQCADVECLATGVYSPLTGFLKRTEYESVVQTMRLPSGVVWPIPVTFATNEDVKEGDVLGLTWKEETVAVLIAEDVFTPNKKEEAQQVYGTTDDAHPGVKELYEKGKTYIGGALISLQPTLHDSFGEHRLTPKQTRALFEERGWKTVVAFQTRNPLHRAHEYLQKTALEMVDGLFLSPIVGHTKKDDVPAATRIKTYEVVLQKYYPKERVLMGVFPAAMRYAGPREAIMHALARKNYGCTHFIVGRDHAGVGDYYGTYDAQKLFEQFSEEDIGIIPLKFEHAFYSKLAGQMATSKTCPSQEHERLHLSGTKVREMLKNQEPLPPEFTRPEVAEILREAYK